MEEKPKLSAAERHAKHREQYWPMQNWRAWGSWFSWGSPVGLGLFFMSIAATLWILSQAFGWK